jgi:hypothetical protein
MRARIFAVLTIVLAVLWCGSAAVLGAEANDPPPATPQLSAAEMNALLDLLVAKGLLTPEELEQLKQQAAAEAAQPVPPPPPPPPPPAPEKPKYPTTKFKVRLQPRFSSVENDENQPYFGERDEQSGNDGFSIRRARLYLFGQLNPQVGYTIQYQADAGAENPNLHIAQAEWKGWQPINLVAGQLQTPFGYEITLCDAYLLTIDRAVVSDFIPPDKDLGVRFDSKIPIAGKLNYQFFVGNGGTKYKPNPNGGLLWVGRVTASPAPHLCMGADYSINSDTDASPYQSRFLKKNGDPYGLLPFYSAARMDERAWSADFQYQLAPFALWGEYIRGRLRPREGGVVTADGWYVDVGYFVPYQGRDDKLQLVAEYQRFDANKAVTDRFDLGATTLGLNYYIVGYEQMLRLNYVWMNEKVDPVDNNRLILQYQLWF